jgi:hypothetical protein
VAMCSNCRLARQMVPRHPPTQNRASSRVGFGGRTCHSPENAQVTPLGRPRDLGARWRPTASLPSPVLRSLVAVRGSVLASTSSISGPSAMWR